MTTIADNWIGMPPDLKGVEIPVSTLPKLHEIQDVQGLSGALLRLEELAAAVDLAEDPTSLNDAAHELCDFCRDLIVDLQKALRV